MAGGQPEREEFAAEQRLGKSRFPRPASKQSWERAEPILSTLFVEEHLFGSPAAAIFGIEVFLISIGFTNDAKVRPGEICVANETALVIVGDL
jgi:hypothetical protein